MIATQNPGKYIVLFYASGMVCVSAELGSNAIADTRNALRASVDGAPRNKVEFWVAHRYGLFVYARGPMKGERSLSPFIRESSLAATERHSPVGFRSVNIVFISCWTSIVE